MSVTRQLVGLHDQLSRFTGRRFRLMAKCKSNLQLGSAPLKNAVTRESTANELLG
jgi:hypothetical protein